MAKKKTQENKSSNTPVNRDMRIHDSNIENYTNRDFVNFMEQLKFNDQNQVLRIQNLEHLLEHVITWKWGAEGLESFSAYMDKKNESDVKKAKETMEDEK
tara:strand:+ start:198 stop:497 length:300 start_codon:yes stop_codon:yes gene_type:complete